MIGCTVAPTLGQQADMHFKKSCTFQPFGPCSNMAYRHLSQVIWSARTHSDLHLVLLGTEDWISHIISTGGRVFLLCQSAVAFVFKVKSDLIPVQAVEMFCSCGLLTKLRNKRDMRRLKKLRNADNATVQCCKLQCDNDGREQITIDWSSSAPVPCFSSLES